LLYHSLHVALPIYLYLWLRSSFYLIGFFWIHNFLCSYLACEESLSRFSRPLSIVPELLQECSPENSAKPSPFLLPFSVVSLKQFQNRIHRLHRCFVSGA